MRSVIRRRQWQPWGKNDRKRIEGSVLVVNSRSGRDRVCPRLPALHDHCERQGTKTPRRNAGGTQPNKLLHFDFLMMLQGTDGAKYVLVLKDGMSGFVELIPCPAATSAEASKDLLD